MKVREIPKKVFMKLEVDDLEIKFNALTGDWISSHQQSFFKNLIFNCETMKVQDFMKDLVIIDTE